MYLDAAKHRGCTQTTTLQGLQNLLPQPLSLHEEQTQ